MGATIGSSDRPATTLPDLAWAAAAAALVLALALPGTVISRQLGLERRASSDEAAVGPAARELARDLDRIVVALAEAATVEDADSALTAVAGAQLPAVLEVSYITVQGRGEGTSLIPAPVLEELYVLGDRARDTGRTLVTVPFPFVPGEPGDGVEGESAPALAVVAPHYERGDGDTGELPVPRFVDERRARHAGWLVAVIDPAMLVSAHVPAGTVVQVTDGDTTFGPVRSQQDTRADMGAPRLRPGLPEVVVDTHERRFRVRGGDPRDVPWAARTIVVGAGGVVLAAVAGVATWWARRRTRDLARDVQQLEAQVDLIGEVAPVVQRSLDLADVLPSVAVQLMDHFGLRGVRLSATGAGPPVELFGLGARPVDAVAPAGSLPEAVGAGESLSLALQRGGRIVAVLQLVSGRALEDAELRSLRAITELITAAIVNARLYASQQDLVRQLRELDTLKTVFLGTASHELRTPATTIGGFASLLANSWDDLDDEKRRTFAGRIAANARSLASVVQDLLDFSLLDQGRLVVSVTELDLAEAVRGVVDRLGPALAEHEVDLRLAPTPVAGDHNGIDRIVTNLLTNAVKYSPAGSRITIEVAPADDGGMLVVSDQGPGVPPDERAQIFTRFYRGSGETVLATRGVGIGLSVVAEFVERLDGRVQVDEAPGGGARFTVWLPAATPAAEIEEIVDASAR
jgi:signal transduction histidine kinase